LGGVANVTSAICARRIAVASAMVKQVCDGFVYPGGCLFSDVKRVAGAVDCTEVDFG
jgi:hypothetical protein